MIPDLAIIFSRYWRTSAGGVRLSSEMSAVDPDRQALLLERMANAECSADNYLVAASLHQKATDSKRASRASVDAIARPPCSY
jgi:hypothetical protein